MLVENSCARSGRPESEKGGLAVSRIGRLPVVIPAGVQVDLNGPLVSVKGPKGELAREFSPSISINFDSGQIVVSRSSEEPTVRALHGMTRALIQNMVTGVSQGFTKVLEIDGVGYRAEMDGQNLKLFVGFSHPVIVEAADGITFEVETRARQIKVMGRNREQVGQVAADIRKIRPPEPYHGKGIHYLGERIRRKAGKAGKGGKK
jgi:large subunit ribosomal protein L6